MQFATAALFLFAAMGAIANPVEGNSEGIDVRATETIFHGTCSKVKDECNYKGEHGKLHHVKCPPKDKCTKKGAKCTFNSKDKKVICH
ncbi:antifungal protein [Apiospora kogelbergensis]|uniref:Antifungal protein n=1 Tax=Apiospora kogelbergensis TaxID=1337665 RepID=A0AAW0RB02_9PEZI